MIVHERTLSPSENALMDTPRSDSRTARLWPNASAGPPSADLAKRAAARGVCFYVFGIHPFVRFCARSVEQSPDPISICANGSRPGRSRSMPACECSRFPVNAGIGVDGSNAARQTRILDRTIPLGASPRHPSTYSILPSRLFLKCGLKAVPPFPSPNKQAFSTTRHCPIVDMASLRTERYRSA